MSEIRTKPANDKFRKRYDSIRWDSQKKSKKSGMEKYLDDCLKSAADNVIKLCDENIDWGEFKTTVCVNNDHNFGG